MNVAGQTVGQAVFEPGWRWSEHVKPIAGTESCQVSHLGYVVSGRMHVVMDDGSEGEVGPGDVVIISATPIPGNERGVSRTINNLMKRGAEVLYTPLRDVHVSGHAAKEEQKLVLSLLKPKFFVPVHGEFRHLKHHAETAMSPA